MNSAHFWAVHLQGQSHGVTVIRGPGAGSWLYACRLLGHVNFIECPASYESGDMNSSFTQWPFRWETAFRRCQHYLVLRRPKRWELLGLNSRVAPCTLGFLCSPGQGTRMETRAKWDNMGFPWRVIKKGFQKLQNISVQRISQLDASRLLGIPNKPTHNPPPKKKPHSWELYIFILVSSIYYSVENEHFCSQTVFSYGYQRGKRGGIN